MSIQRWPLPIILFVLAILNSVQTTSIQHVILKQKIQVKTNKRSPAYQAFQLVRDQEKHIEKNCGDSCEMTELQATSFSMNELKKDESPYRIGKMVWLSKVSIQREVLQSPHVMLANARTPQTQNRFSATLASQRGVNASGGSRFQLSDLVMDHSEPNAQASFLSRRNDRSGAVGVNPLHLQGKIELAGGLAVTDRMSIIVGRHEEGQIQEYGTVDIGSGLYEVRVQKRSGIIVGKLVDEHDQLVGEGFFQLGQDGSNPKLVIEPVKSYSGAGNFAYSPPPPPKPDYSGATQTPSVTRAQEPNQSGKEQTVAHLNFGSGYQEELNPLQGDEKSYTRIASSRGTFEDTNKNSFAILRSAAKDFFQTNQIVSPQDKVENTLYPQGMIESLRKLVAEQKTSDPQFESLQKIKLEEMTVIFGQVFDEQKPSSGVSVFLERYPDMIPIYFNALMLPDLTLKTTSANGYFAFLGPPEGLQSLVARRGTAYISHVNAYVEAGAVAQANIHTTLSIAESKLVVFDAFTGAPQNMRVSLQSLSQDVETSEKDSNILLPMVNRMSLAHTDRTAVYYPSTFVYNDKQNAIFLPLIQTEWLNIVGQKIYEKSGQQIGSTFGMIVGFVQDDDYIVEVMDYKSDQKTQVIYFDAMGNILEQQYGIGGGGFIIPNFEDDSAQIKVTGKNSGISYLQIIPVDSQSASVLSFKLQAAQ